MTNSSLPDLGMTGRGLTSAYVDQMRSVVLGQSYISEELRQRSMSMENRMTEFAAERGSVSNEFATISEHIVDALREASRSSTFERADQISTMKYIRDVIKSKVTDTEEQEKLLEAWKDARDSIKDHTTIFSKAQNLFINQLGTFTGIFASMIPNLPPIFSVLATQGGNLLGKWLERRKTRKERERNLSEEIDAQNQNGLVQTGFQREEPPRMTPFPDTRDAIEEEPWRPSASPFTPVPGSDLFRNGIFREGFVREVSPQAEPVQSQIIPAPLGRRGFGRVHPDGSKRRPFFVRSVGMKDGKDEKGLLGKLFSMIMGSALFKAISGFLGTAGALLSGKSLAGAAASRLGLGKAPVATPQPQKPSLFQRAKSAGSGILQKGKDLLGSGVGFIKEKGASIKDTLISGFGKVKDAGSSLMEKGRGVVSSGMDKAKTLIGGGIEKGTSLFKRSGEVLKAIPWKKVVVKFGVKNALRALAVAAGIAAAPLSGGASTLISAASGALLAKDIYDIGQTIRESLAEHNEESLAKTEQKAQDITASVSEKGTMEPQKEGGFNIEKPKTEPISTGVLGTSYAEKSRVLSQSINQNTTNTVVQNTPVSVTNVTNLNNRSGKSASPVIIMDNPNSGIAAGYMAR